MTRCCLCLGPGRSSRTRFLSSFHFAKDRPTPFEVPSVVLRLPSGTLQPPPFRLLRLSVAAVESAGLSHGMGSDRQSAAAGQTSNVVSSGTHIPWGSSASAAYFILGQIWPNAGPSGGGGGHWALNVLPNLGSLKSLLSVW